MGILPATLARNSAMGDIQMKFVSRTDKTCASQRQMVKMPG
jgi:hypothetical protein